MKKLILLLLFTTISYSQETTVSFFYGTENTAGAELLTHVKGTESFYLGAGFGGVLDQDRYKDDENWYDVYMITSFGYIGKVMIKEKVGISTTISDNGKKVSYKTLIGVGAMYQVNKNYGIELGMDTFNKISVGFCVVF